MKRLLASVACVGAMVLGASASDASAGPPAVPGCVGQSVSANAKVIRPYGAFIRDIAPRNDFGTVGDAVQALGAGLIPDEVYANTCN